MLVTGGGSGIGRLMCLRFARLGAIVVTWDINDAGNKETVAMIKKEGHKAFDFKVDMTNRYETVTHKLALKGYLYLKMMISI